MQPGLTTSAKPILMDRFATQATNVTPKVINLIRIVNAPAQATNPMPRKSACTRRAVNAHQCTRVRRLDCSMRFSQNAKLLSPQGLFISSIDHQEPSFSLQYLAPLQIVEDLLFARRGGRKMLGGALEERGWLSEWLEKLSPIRSKRRHHLHLRVVKRS